MRTKTVEYEPALQPYAIISDSSTVNYGDSFLSMNHLHMVEQWVL